MEIVGGVSPQLVVTDALHVAVLITDTVLSFVLPTYAVCVAWIHSDGNGGSADAGGELRRAAKPVDPEAGESEIAEDPAEPGVGSAPSGRVPWAMTGPPASCRRGWARAAAEADHLPQRR